MSASLVGSEMCIRDSVEEAAVAFWRVLPMTATTSSSAYQDILGWGLVLAKTMAYTWGLGLALAVLGSVLRGGVSGPCARGLL
eukprot:5683462-Alexandrium_andersonii.AAC.1